MSCAYFVCHQRHWWNTWWGKVVRFPVFFIVTLIAWLCYLPVVIGGICFGDYHE